MGTPYKMKGSPMQRNFGIGSPVRQLVRGKLRGESQQDANVRNNNAMDKKQEENYPLGTNGDNYVGSDNRSWKQKAWDKYGPTINASTKVVSKDKRGNTTYREDAGWGKSKTTRTTNSKGEYKHDWEGHPSSNAPKKTKKAKN